MKSSSKRVSVGFTLMETVIAIGVLAVLLTSFMAVFGPAASQLRKAISVQEADRMVSSLEREMSSVRPGEENTYTSGFDKGYKWITESAQANKAILIYQYRGNLSKSRSDGSLEPYTANGGVAGRDFVVQPMVRQRDDQQLKDDFQALEGPIYTVKLKQLIFDGGQLTENQDGEIKPTDPNSNSNNQTTGTGSDAYPDAMIAFESEFYIVPNNSIEYVQPGGKFDPQKLTKPIFTNNMAIRR